MNALQESMDCLISKTVSVIIVNFNTYSHCSDCISNLLKQTSVNLQIIVVDNNSQDGSVVKLKEKFGSKVEVIANNENLGFAKANNMGAKIAHGSYIACINPDILLERPDIIYRLVKFLSANHEVGVIAPKVLEPRKNRVIKPKRSYPQQHLLKIQTFLDRLPGDYAWLLGAFLLFQKDVYKKIHGFDEDYFLYGEDTDICLKVRKAGYKIDYIEDVEVVHWSGASEINSEFYSKWLRKKNGYYLFCKKNYPHKDFLTILGNRLLHCNFKKILLSTKYFFYKSNKIKESFEKVRAEIDVIKNFKKLTLDENR
jgi:GT2 family glycosyltransferase